MFSVDLNIRECGGHVVVALRGELDVADAAPAAAAFAVVAGRQPQIVADLEGLEFIDSSGVAALARGRKLARQAGGDLLLAAPRRHVRRFLASIRLSEVFQVHATVDEAVAITGLSAQAADQRPRDPFAARGSDHAGRPEALRKTGAFARLPVTGLLPPRTAVGTYKEPS